MRRLLLSVIALIALAACGAHPGGFGQDKELDALFASLKGAQSAEAAAPLEHQIWGRWTKSGSATVDVLMERAQLAENARDTALAFRLLDKASELAPDYAQPWNQRADLAYKTKDYRGALAAIRETLKREPRHFGALTGMGLIYEELGQKKAALEAYRAALAVHPYYAPALSGAARLEPSVDGRDA